MKKIVIFFLTVMLFANITDKYLEYTNKLVYYGFDLKDFNKIKPPFKVKKLIIVNNSKEKIYNNVFKTINIKLLAILNNQAYLCIKEYLGGQLIKKFYKWVKVNQKIENCKIIKITSVNVILQCNNKKLIKTLNKKIPGFKEKK